MTQTNRDELFYFSMIIFQVEGCLFKVPRRPFEDQSDVFKSMFTLPPGQNIVVDGMSDDKPLLLENIKKDDFRAFLHVLFPPAYGEEVDLTQSQWEAILNLSNMWGFEKIRLTAVERLQNSNIDLVTKIELAHKYEIREWLYSSYLALGKREEPLSVEEGGRLGYDFALKMAQIRERLLKDKIEHPAAYQNLRTASSSSPRGGRGGGARAAALRVSAWRSSQIFPGEIEDEDDIFLSRAIHEVFGVKGKDEIPMMYGDADLESRGLGQIPPQHVAQPIPWHLHNLQFQ